MVTADPTSCPVKIPTCPAINATQLDSSIRTRLWTEPAKIRPGYANFAVAEPPLKLVLIEGVGEPGSLNHLGVEVESTDEVMATNARLTGEGLACATEEEVSCCFAVQNKVWVDAPDNRPWEIYTVLADAEMPPGELRTVEPGAAEAALCCGSAPESEARCC